MQPFTGKTSLLVASIVLFTASACRKNNQDAMPPPPPAAAADTSPGISQAVLKDSILFYSRDIYLWNREIPASFNPQSFSSPEDLMEGLRPYSNEPGFNGPVDRWSFAMKQTDWDNMSGGLNLLQDDVTSSGDFGMTVFFLKEGDLRVRLAEPESPAGKAGIRRGWQITGIDGNTNITTNNADFIVKRIYESPTATVTFKKPDGSSQAITLSAAHYKEKPVYLDTVYTVASKKIGYLVFNSFLGDENSVYSEFQRVFNKFSSAGVTDLVVDLRYNGGGYVSIQQRLANYLINNAGNGGVMMKQVYNDANAQYNETTNFEKRGSLNLSKIYFIVTNGTASASELLINNLKPYMDVRLVGSSRTHGKPVGFFPIPVGKEWYIFPVSFRSVNKNGEGNYFNGISVNSTVKDGLDKDWGDTKESCLASTIRNITTGNFRQADTGNISESSVDKSVAAGNAALDAPFLKVTIGKKRY